MSEGTLGFNLRSAEFLADPYPYYRQLRERSPIIFSEDWNAWFVTSYDGCRNLLRDNRLGHAAAPDNPFIFQNPPQHTRLRKLTAIAFSKDYIDAHRGKIKERMDRIIADIPRGEKVDLMQALAFPFPVSVIADMFGYPDSDFDKLMRWAHAMELTFDPLQDVNSDTEVITARNEFAAYLQQLLMQRMAAPGDDMLTRLMSADVDGDRLTPGELISTSILLLVAGYITTANLIGNGVKLLLRNPDQLEILRQDTSLVSQAVEELLRLEPPGQIGHRYAMEDMAYGDHTFKKGELVFLCAAAANRDPAMFDDPESVDVKRKPNPHLGFGGGIHACLGAPLGHLEARIAFEAILTELPDLKLVEGGYEYYDTFVFRALKKLEVTT